MDRAEKKRARGREREGAFQRLHEDSMWVTGAFEILYPEELVQVAVPLLLYVLYVCIFNVK